MVSVVNNVVDQTWEQVSRWPQEWRLSLAQRLLHSINESASGSPTPSGSPGDLIGAWNVANPPLRSAGSLSRPFAEQKRGSEPDCLAGILIREILLDSAGRFFTGTRNFANRAIGALRNRKKRLKVQF